MVRVKREMSNENGNLSQAGETWTPTILNVGDTITIAGEYHRRTFWEWLWNMPKRQKEWTVTSSTSTA